MSGEESRGSLKAEQIDALREVGNVGAGNAAIALSQMVGRKVEVEVTTASSIPLNAVTELVGGPETPVAGVHLKIEGDFSGSILLLLQEDSAQRLAALMVPEDMRGEDDVVVRHSALQETGSILSHAYLNALSRFTGLFYKPSVPGFAMDMAGAMMDTVLVDLGTAEDLVLVVETDFKVSGQEIRGHLVLFPDRGSLSTILNRLGVPFD